MTKSHIKFIHLVVHFWLTIYRGGANWYLRAGATNTNTPAGGFSIANDAAYMLSIDNNGKVGIGTASPSTLLHVNGKLTISDGTQGQAKVLTSDANGTASWTDSKSLHPGFKVQGNAGQAVGNGQVVSINFGQTIFDDANAVGSNSSSYIIPAAGTYYFEVRVSWDVNFAEIGGVTTIYCLENGGYLDWQNTLIPALGQVAAVSTYSGLFKFNGGELISFAAYQLSLGGHAIYNDGGSSTEWSGYKVN